MGTDSLRRPVAKLSRGDVLLLIALLAVFGLVDALYLTYLWVEAATSSWCDLSAFFNCTTVAHSGWASIGGVVPTALVGAAGFAILLALAILGLRGRERVGPWTVDRWLLAFAAVGSLLGLALTFAELFDIRAVCILCAIGFALDLGILALADLPPAQAGEGGELTG